MIHGQLREQANGPFPERGGEGAGDFLKGDLGDKGQSVGGLLRGSGEGWWQEERDREKGKPSPRQGRVPWASLPRSNLSPPAEIFPFASETGVGCGFHTRESIPSWARPQ